MILGCSIYKLTQQEKPCAVFNHNNNNNNMTKFIQHHNEAGVTTTVPNNVQPLMLVISTGNYR